MNTNIWEGKWKQLKGEVQKQWGELTNDDLDKIEGSREKLEGLLQEKYGDLQNDTRNVLDELEKKYSNQLNNSENE